MDRARKGKDKKVKARRHQGVAAHEAHPGLTLSYFPCFALKTFIFPKLELAFHKLSSSALAGLETLGREKVSSSRLHGFSSGACHSHKARVNFSPTVAERH